MTKNTRVTERKMARRIEIRIKNCYGITAFSHEFDFSKKSPVLIYSPNGVMKTSFAKTLKDYSDGKRSKDYIFTDRETLLSISDQDGKALDPDSVFVVESMNDKFKPNNTGALMINNLLNRRFKEIYFELSEEINELFNRLKVKSGIGTNEELVKEIFQVFHETKIQKLLVGAEEDVRRYGQSKFSKVNYIAFFSTEALKFFERPDIKNIINKIGETYIESDHLMVSRQLVQKINESNSVGGLKELHDHLNENPSIVVEFRDINKLKWKVWISYFSKLNGCYEEFIEQHKHKSKEYRGMMENARNSKNTQWDRVMEEFNDRFFVPFRIEVKNRDVVVMGYGEPVFRYFYQEGVGSDLREVEVDLDTLDLV